jgi:hypothetical protein
MNSFERGYEMYKATFSDGQVVYVEATTKGNAVKYLDECGDYDGLLLLSIERVRRAK